VPSEESKILEGFYANLRSTLEECGTLPPPATRAIMDVAMAALPTEPPGVLYSDTSADGVGALWSTPPDSDPNRVILYMHGGGYFCGSTASHRKLTGHLALAAGMPVLSVDYALTPDRPHPAQVDDAATAFRWLRRQGVAAEHIAVAGDSAGGGLCTSVVLRLREGGDELPAAVAPISPWYDLELVGETIVASRGTGDLVGADALEPMAAAFLQGQSPSDPIANPLHADLAGFPPVLIHVGGAESLLSDSQTFGELAKAAGVEVTVVVEPGLPHVFLFGAGRVPEADDAIRRIGSWIREKLHAPERELAAK
jgi:epsilon-lactone hydrolase